MVLLVILVTMELVVVGALGGALAYTIGVLFVIADVLLAVTMVTRLVLDLRREELLIPETVPLEQVEILVLAGTLAHLAHLQRVYLKPFLEEPLETLETLELAGLVVVLVVLVEILIYIKAAQHPVNLN